MLQDSLEGPQTFLGSMICYKSSLSSCSRTKLPETIYCIVDGQQRITMVSTIAILLHSQMQSAQPNNMNKWLGDAVDGTQEALRKLIFVKIDDKEAPRVIREEQDIWAEHQYVSPLASFTYKFLEHVKGGKTTRFNYRAASGSEVFNKLMGKLDKSLNSFYERMEMELPIENQSFMQNMWPDDRGEAGKLAKENPKLFLNLLLAKYLYNQMNVVEIRVEKDDGREFDVFDRLNTTGASLNAFEAFKPLIIRSARLGGYAGDEQESLVKKLEDSYVSIESRSASDKYVSELIVSFALANSGKKLKTERHAQREYLRGTFEARNNNEEHCLDYLRLLQAVNDMKRLFDDDDNGIERFLTMRGISIPKGKALKENITEATFCLRFLSRGGYSITIALLSIYLHQVRQRQDEASIQHFCYAVCKVAAFFAIWLSSDDTTNRVEEQIRNIIKGNAATPGPLCRYHNENSQIVEPFDMKYLGPAFKKQLADMYEIKDADTWYERVSKIQIYKRRKELVRFLLLVGSNKTRAVKRKGRRTPELVTDASAEKLITKDGFDSDLFKEIEHIIPINEGNNQKTEYSKEEKDKLWNLTLVPADVNKILGNKDWVCKKAIYQYFSAETDEEQQKFLAALPNILNPEQHERFIEQKAEHGYLPMTKYLALMPDTFDESDVESRNKQVIKRCWKVFSQWLNRFPGDT